MKAELKLLRDACLKDLENVKNLKDLDDVRIKYLGKKGILTTALKGMGRLSSEERPIIGKLANDIREELEKSLLKEKTILENEKINAQLVNEVIDVSLPGKRCESGNLHPLSIIINELEEVFLGMGFSIAEGPEIEWAKYNFDYLNVPLEHSARDLQDTFYYQTDSDEIVLRTQTSPVQVRVMENQKPPLRVISPGRVYRSDEIDATHSPVFHQMEGLVIDKGITMSDLKGTLDMFAKKLFGEDTKTKFRPHQFYFTEPSAEMDVTCFKCGGKGCKVCSNTGWIEILGCGMVHPNVLRTCNIDPEIYSGFAFGMGLDRITMIKYGINDLRLLFENDLRFLGQFK
ncbi:MAG: phenylalanine--tRNA ligase subunit alpha [Eubacteriaceae bacterium]